MSGVSIKLVNERGEPVSDAEFSQDTLPLLKLTRAIAEGCQRLDAFRLPKFKLNEEDRKDCDLPAKLEQPLTIEVVVTEDEEFLSWWDAGDNVLGLHAVTSGAFEHIEGTDLSDKHRVIVLLSPQALREFLLKEREMEVVPSNARYDTVNLMSYLNTVTHELGHALEFIEHANGMTPYAAQLMVEEGHLGFDLSDLSTGNGILAPYSEDHRTVVELMEERVEEKGRQWLSQIHIPPALIRGALEAYAPSFTPVAGNDLDERSPGF